VIIIGPLSVQKVFLYDPTLIHNASVTDRQTNGRTRDRRQWYHRRLQHSCNIFFKCVKNCAQ